MDKNANMSLFYLINLVTQSTIDLDYMITSLQQQCTQQCLKLVDSVHLQEKYSIKTGFLLNYQIIKIIHPTKLQYNFWVGGKKRVGRWRTNKQKFIFSPVYIQRFMLQTARIMRFIKRQSRIKHGTRTNTILSNNFQKAK